MACEKVWLSKGVAMVMNWAQAHARCPTKCPLPDATHSYSDYGLNALNMKLVGSLAASFQASFLLSARGSIMRPDRRRESRVARLCLAQSSQSQSPEKAAARELLERSPGLEKKRPAARISGEDSEPSDRVTVIRREPTRAEKLKTCGRWKPGGN